MQAPSMTTLAVCRKHHNLHAQRNVAQQKQLTVHKSLSDLSHMLCVKKKKNVGPCD